MSEDLRVYPGLSRLESWHAVQRWIDRHGEDAYEAEVEKLSPEELKRSIVRLGMPPDVDPA